MATSRADLQQRKRSGVFYTPAAIAAYMVASTLQTELADAAAIDQVRVLDPACGDGALLWPAYQQLCQCLQATNAESQFGILKRQLFGVELDPSAIERLRQRFFEHLPAGIPSDEFDSTFDQNVHCGNAVNGLAWAAVRGEMKDGPDRRLSLRESPLFRAAKGRESNDKSPTALNQSNCFHWSEQFPEVHQAGGFDIIVANPPYRRERGAKVDLLELETSPLGKQRRHARMDLWHYFFHRTLDLLKAGGLLTFIVNSYWTMSRAGRPLVDRLIQETTPLEFILLEDAPVFTNVAGRHLILRLRKGITNERCSIRRLRDQDHARVLDASLWSSLVDTQASIPTDADSTPFESRDVTRDELFQNGRLNLEAPSAATFAIAHSGDSSTPSQAYAHYRLGDLFEVRQGIAENPPRITRQQAQSYLEYRSGEGVFVLTTTEVEQLSLTEPEQKLLRPYYNAAEIQPNWQPTETNQYLIYLTRQTAADITMFPRIHQHLNRFRQILELRREVRQGKIAWWHLHWPREPRLFEQPRILAVQMCQTPRFAYIEQPTYVGFSINVIVNRPVVECDELGHGWTLRSLTEELNSARAADWFEQHAKRRGVNLDITGATLKSFPLSRRA